MLRFGQLGTGTLRLVDPSYKLIPAVLGRLADPEVGPTWTWTWPKKAAFTLVRTVLYCMLGVRLD